MFDKDEQEFSQILETGLDAILSGEATLEQVLAEHPDQASQLRPELESALWLYSAREKIAPRPGFISNSRKRVLERIKNEAASAGAKRAFMGFAWPQRLPVQWVAAAILLLVLFSGTGGLVSVSQRAIPGDPLYSVKTASEQVALSFTFNQVRQIQLSQQFADRRLAEVAQLIEQGRYDLAEETLKAYEQQVRRTMAMLQNAAGMSAHDKKTMATALEATLAAHAEDITRLEASAPPALTEHLDRKSVV